VTQMRERVAVVTGGASGLGRAAVLELARAGARIVVVDVDAERGEGAAAEARSLGADARFVRADVSDARDVAAYVDAALGAFGRIDAFINNAGVPGVVAPIGAYPDDVFDRVFAVNVRGVFLGLKAVLPVMQRQKSGSVVNTASIIGQIAAPGIAAYAASKCAIVGLTRVAAAEVARDGVRVNAVCPGPIHTPLMRDFERMITPDDPEVALRLIAEPNPSGRYGDPEEAARVMVFLASDAASYVNGAAWAVDGGRTAV
jgi:NAD(P)-dependent dehydrogenase (short-subunit alcohol dehydrogenase family)